MLFNSFAFLLVYLPAVLMGFYLTARFNPRLAAFWLAVASLGFYWWWSPPFTLLLCASIAGNYLCGLMLLKLESRPTLQGGVLIAGVTANLSLLFYFKYLFPLFDWLAGVGVTGVPSGMSVLLPLGISFFTFTQIGFLADCRAGEVSTRGLLDYVLFVTFFPHLIAGPILHHSEMMPQFAARETYRFRTENLAVGLSIFVLGLGKKVLIADSLSDFVATTFSQPADVPFFTSWAAAIAFSLQLYFDFSGYSDMAVGLARMFGVKFPANFASPYKARNIIEFWQRWHMTLTSYLTLYLYTPMAVWIARRQARRRKGKPRLAGTSVRVFAASIMAPTLYTMVLAGIWHGAGLQYLIFGLLHGLYLTVNHAWRVFGRREPAEAPSAVWRHAVHMVCILATFAAVTIAFVFFRAASLGDALELVRSMLGSNGIQPPALSNLLALQLFAILGIAWFLPNTYEIFARYSPVLSDVKATTLAFFQWRPGLGWALVIGAIFAACCNYLAGTSEFLYFQF